MRAFQSIILSAFY